MKTLIVTLLVSFPFLTNAQTFWSVAVDDSEYNISHVTDKGLFQDSLFLISGFISDASCHGQRLFAYNQTGERQWDIGGYHDLIQTDSNFIYTAGYTPIDDVVGVEQIIVSKYNKYGNEIFSIGYPEIPHDYYFEFTPKNIDLVKNGTILISSDKSIIKSTINGGEIKGYNITLETPINAIHSITPLSYLINTANKIYKTDSALTIIDSLEFSNSINQLLVVNDTVFTLCDSYLIRADTNLNILDTVITSPTPLDRMEQHENELWVQLFSSDSLQLIKLENAVASDTLAFPTLMNNTEFVVSNNNFTFVGNSFTNQIGIHNYTIENNKVETISLPDIELVDFTIDSIVIEYVETHVDTFATGYRFNTELTIKNKSDVTLNSFAVFSDLHGGMNCAQNYFYQKFSNLEILPGQTHKVNLKRKYEEGTNNNQLCFKCLAPNSALEINTSNNSLCRTFTITGIKKETQRNFEIYPNPVNDYLIIEQPGLGLRNIEIVDLNGKVIISSVSSEPKTRIETSSLTTGLYIVKIKMRNSILTKGIFKE